MAAIIAILKAVGKANRRELSTLLSAAFNNFFFVAVIIAYGALASGKFPAASAPFFSLLVVLLLFPSSADPLARMPASFWALSPLSTMERFVLRVLCLAFSPSTWLALVVLVTLRAKAALVFVALILCIRAVSLTGSRIRNRWGWFYLPRLVPPIPLAMGRLMRGNIRQLSCMLDFYLAFVLCAVGSGYRFFGNHPDPAAFPVLAILVGLALSTCAQSLFGLDGPGGLTRYRLLPCPAWQVLAAKDAAFMAVLGLLSLPLSFRTGVTFGLAALAIGRYPSLVWQLPQQKWRFARGDIRFGFAQIFLATAIASDQRQTGPAVMAIAVVAYLISLVWGGWYMERSRNR